MADRIKDFNPLHHEGGDIRFRSCGLLAILFQSTPPRGWRLSKGKSRLQAYQNFNPLHHEGGDGKTGPVGVRWTDFNPLHHEGGDSMMRITDVR